MTAIAILLQMFAFVFVVLSPKHQVLFLIAAIVLSVVIGLTTKSSRSSDE